jgi:hypothetical protein
MKTIGVFPINKSFNVYFQKYTDDIRLFISTVKSDSNGLISFNDNEINNQVGGLLINMIDIPYSPNFFIPYPLSTSTTLLPPTQQVLNKIVDESNSFSLLNDTIVYYGVSGSKLVSKLIPKGTCNCNNNTFTDPLPGLKKYCYIDNNNMNNINNTLSLTYKLNGC